MRNLAKYPITADEVLATIENLYEISLEDIAPGDTEALILSKVGDFLRLERPALEAFLKENGI